MRLGDYFSRREDGDHPSTLPDRPWNLRSDAFSTYRAGFEIRTYRLCRRVMMFHRFPEQLGEDPCLVRSTDLEHRQDAYFSYMTAATESGYRRRRDGSYVRRSCPPLEFGYIPRTDEISGKLHSLEGAAAGIVHPCLEWVDLDGVGLAGMLSRASGAWRFKRNLGQGRVAVPEARVPQPSLPASGTYGRRGVHGSGE